jgi:hypothetical protein
VGEGNRPARHVATLTRHGLGDWQLVLYVDWPAPERFGTWTEADRYVRELAGGVEFRWRRHGDVYEAWLNADEI